MWDTSAQGWEERGGSAVVGGLTRDGQGRKLKKGSRYVSTTTWMRRFR